MHRHDWLRVRDDLQQTPIVEGRVPGASSLFIERYRFQTIERTVAGLSDLVLVTQFGGGQVTERANDQVRSTVVPTQSLLVPASVETHWRYSSSVDFSVFYFESRDCPVQNKLRKLMASAIDPVLFSDPLVGAAAVQLVAMLQNAGVMDESFSARLAQVMLEQIHRVLTDSSGLSLDPLQAQQLRMGAVVKHIDDSLTGDLSTAALARYVSISEAHFRRLFQDAVGLPPHRYVLSRRIERARTLLTQSRLPISMVADQCGFSSQSHLTRCFRLAHAVTPAEFRARVLMR